MLVPTGSQEHDDQQMLVMLFQTQDTHGVRRKHLRIQLGISGLISQSMNAGFIALDHT
ncbi:hypothetical protein CHARACLAT_029197, partial [Characodon lateralis]|nr:hypothetical protein [Ataeniobius toweri]MED6275713.1 hypothetical protein [Characodon lateralis]